MNLDQSSEAITNEIMDLFAERGEEAYFGEAVSQQAHALQAANLAVTYKAPKELIVAALLHDVGHLISGHDETVADQGIDARHEEAGQVWLARYFGPAVTEPVRLHVDAKRYLCATDGAYQSALSPASAQSLALQGGPMKESERMEFEQNRFYQEAVRLRRWDDEAKDPNLQVPGLEAYRNTLRWVLNNN